MDHPSPGLALVGAHGRMGRRLDALAREAGFEVRLRVDREGPELATSLTSEIAVIIDFSHASEAPRTVAAAVQAGCPCVLGTTGLTPEAEAAVRSAARAIPLVWAPNFSVGVTVLTHLVAQAARQLGEGWDLEIVETHHRAKVDAPSGTALGLATAAAEARGWSLPAVAAHGREGQTGARPAAQIGLHAVRGGSVVGDHTVALLGAGETLTLGHQALDRDIFARGALRAARWLLQGRGGAPSSGSAPGSCGLATPGSAAPPGPGLYDMRAVLGLG
jgi:4-hydroxy-tetrahydrodipicolinate reductase